MSENKSLTRSDLVRKRRRAQILHQPRPPKKKVFAGSSPRELPPIAMRGVVNEHAFERYQKAGRRNFNSTYSLPLGGTRPLSLSRIWTGIGWKSLSFLILLCLSTGLYLLWSRPELRVTSAEVSGNLRISTEEINSMLGLKGHPSFLLDPREIEKQVLRDYPEIQSIQVSISMPNLVRVQVVERQPLILWQQEGGYTWIDESGVAFRPHGEVQDLIIVNALSAPPPLADPEYVPILPSPFISQDTVKALQVMTTLVPPGTPILFDATNGLSWIDQRGWQAVFGIGSENIAIKVSVYQSLVEWLTQRGIQPVLINVTYPNAPYYRLDMGYAEEE